MSDLESLTVGRVARRTFEVYEKALGARNLREIALERARTGAAKRRLRRNLAERT